MRVFRLGLPCGSGFSLSLKPEGDLDRWSKAIGLTKECQTGDPAFDDTVYVLSDNPRLPSHAAARCKAARRRSRLAVGGGFPDPLTPKLHTDAGVISTTFV